MNHFMRNARRSFEVLRWMSILALMALPFVFRSEGRLSGHQLAAAVGFALPWLAVNVLSWRRRSRALQSLMWLAFVFAPRLAGISGSGSPDSMALTIQWLTVVVVLAGAPLLVARDWFLGLADLRGLPSPFSAEDVG